MVFVVLLPSDSFVSKVFPLVLGVFLSDVVALWEESSSFYGRYFDQLFLQPFLVRLAWYLTRSYLRPSLLVLGSP